MKALIIGSAVAIAGALAAPGGPALAQSGNYQGYQYQGNQYQGNAEFLDDQALARGTLATIQRRLQQYGFYQGGDIDGVWGPNTRQAIANFQQSNGLRATGQVTFATLDALGLMRGGMAQRGSGQRGQMSGSPDGRSGQSEWWQGQSQDPRFTERSQSDAYGRPGPGPTAGQLPAPRMPDNFVPWERP